MAALKTEKQCGCTGWILHGFWRLLEQNIQFEVTILKRVANFW